MTIMIVSSPDLSEEYFLISDSVAEDKELREFLRIKRIVNYLTLLPSYYYLV